MGIKIKSKKCKTKFKAVKTPKRQSQGITSHLIMGNYLHIDPGIQGLGWCVGDFTKWREKIPPLASGCISPPGEWGFEDRALHVCKEIQMVKEKYNIRHVYMEYPQYMQSARGDVAARSGKLVKLCIVYGMAAGS
jgi:hypothetical protein